MPGRRLRYWMISLVMVALLAVLIWGGRQSLLMDGGSPVLRMTGIALGTLVSEDLATITSGLLAASGKLTYPQAVVAAYLGIFIGDLIIFWLGFHFGRPLLRHRWSRWIASEKGVNRAQRLFRHNGLRLILLTRFLPGTRTATYFAAGALHAPVLRFVAAFALAAALWTPFLVGLSFFLGRELVEVYELYEAFALPALVLFGLCLYLIVHYGIPLFTWRGRRRLKGKWIRATQWEFWPWWQVNFVTILYVLWLGLVRYRSSTLFTAVNPCMPDGGFIGESKSDILRGLAGAGDAVPKWRKIPKAGLEEKRKAFLAAMEELQLSYPVVLKPDEGQRGAGVRIVRSEQEAAEWLDGVPGLAILQEFVAGSEYGVFYVRRPSEGVGRITSVTLKKQIWIEGNGRDTIETLIYSHDRAIAMLGTFLGRFGGRLDEIPDAGTRIPLGELGTHARGSLFLDGCHLITPQLASRVNEIASSFDGFYFGRFDLKAPDDEALREGRGIRLMELNGVTAEETHMYDPAHGLLFAWRTLCRQWRCAFEIASENVRSGHRATPPREFLRNLAAARRRQRDLD